jgi:ABC-type multidrug transport system fused ATPase/permease subunit
MADLIVVLTGGTITEIGSHDKLMGARRHLLRTRGYGAA